MANNVFLASASAIILPTAFELKFERCYMITASVMKELSIMTQNFASKLFSQGSIELDNL